MIIFQQQRHGLKAPGAPDFPRTHAMQQRLDHAMHMLIKFGVMNVGIKRWLSSGTSTGAVSQHFPPLAGLDLQQPRHIQSVRRSTCVGSDCMRDSGPLLPPPK